VKAENNSQSTTNNPFCSEESNQVKDWLLISS